MSSPVLASRACEFLKAMREPRAPSEVAEMLGWNRTTAHAWCAEFAAQGILVQAGRAPHRGIGPVPMWWVLAYQWGGPAAVPVADSCAPAHLVAA